ncbi:vWA domain-containing protein [Bifidobacterium leontopitheci]|uniref:VWA domain-containing protein n=1 Tax=Bifidobacterium leontopitheci TaxID=2650774 RepID=A0A6I1GIB5_9BIFI|nr:VWA domain-containing protein [Bifidobacterium leontopitheci]KAB7791410.1 VWA domain-containing protein [Bifidobacterium leontopitheci]
MNFQWPNVQWVWPWAGAAGALLAAVVIAAVLWATRRRRPPRDGMPVFSLDDDLATEHASRLLRLWRALGRLALALLALAVALGAVLAARPATIDRDAERSNTRDIVLCLDVSGSTLPYDRQIIETYRDLIRNFQGERIGMSIFNSTSRTVFPLTDDYDLVSRQLAEAADALHGVESQDDIDKMSDSDYQKISDWLDGTQNRKNSTSLIGDGLVGCAAMLPGFSYGSAQSSRRDASIVLATDNVASGKPTYTLAQALDMASSTGITVDGLFAGPQQSRAEATTTAMRTQIESHGGMFLAGSSADDINELARQIDSRRYSENRSSALSAMIDAPGWWVLALAVVVMVWMAVAWRLRR